MRKRKQHVSNHHEDYARWIMQWVATLDREIQEYDPDDPSDAFLKLTDARELRDGLKHFADLILQADSDLAKLFSDTEAAK
jgi:hypothetical protein